MGYIQLGGSSSSSSNHQHSNLPLLEKIKVDSFGQLYYESGFNPDYLKSGTILALLGSLNDESGYGNIVIPSYNNPIQILGLDGKPALGLTNSTELSVPSIPSLLGGATGATLYAVYSYSTNVAELIRTAQNSGWWNYSGTGYFSVFRNQRLEGYPAPIPSSGNFLISVHSRSVDYEIFINNLTKGVVGGNWYGGDRFIIGPAGSPCVCNLSLLLVIPFWVDKNSLFHNQKLTAIKGRFPSLPFIV
jgi:hypothetical protein